MVVGHPASLDLPPPPASPRLPPRLPSAAIFAARQPYAPRRGAHARKRNEHSLLATRDAPPHHIPRHDRKPRMTINQTLNPSLFGAKKDQAIQSCGALA